MDIDQRILLGLFGLTFLAVVTDFSRGTKFTALRDNFRTVTYGRFEADDFIEKKQ